MRGTTDIRGRLPGTVRRLLLLMLAWSATGGVAVAGDRAADDANAAKRGGLPAGAVMRLGGPGIRHANPIHAMAVTRDGRLLATCELYGRCRLWETATGRLLREFPAEMRKITSLGPGFALSGDGKILARSLRLVTPAAIELFDAQTGKLRKRLLGHTKAISSLAISPDGKTLASLGLDATLRLWDVATGRPLEVMKLKREEWLLRTWMKFSPDGKLLATGRGRWRSVQLWDVKEGEQRFDLPMNGFTLRSLDFSRDSRVLATATSTAIHFWDTQTGKSAGTFQPAKAQIGCFALREGGRVVAWANHRADRVSFWDRKTQKPLRDGPVIDDAKYEFLLLSPDEKLLIGCDGQRARLWDLRKGTELPHSRGHLKRIYDVAYSPDGRYVITASDDRTVRVWDAATGNELRSLRGYETWITCVTVSPDGKLVAAAAEDSNQTIVVWELATGKLLHRLKGYSVVAFTPDGKRLLTVELQKSTGFMRIYDPTTGRLTARWSAGVSITGGLAVSRDGKTLVHGTRDGHVLVWDLTSRKVRKRFRAHKKIIRAVAISPDGTEIVTSSDDRRISTWDARDGRQTGELQAGHHAALIEFAPGGKRLATVDYNAKNCQIWDTATHRRLAKIAPATFNRMRAAAFSPDGKRLAATDGNYSVLIWDVKALLRR